MVCTVEQLLTDGLLNLASLFPSAKYLNYDGHYYYIFNIDTVLTTYDFTRILPRSVDRHEILINLPIAS